MHSRDQIPPPWRELLQELDDAVSDPTRLDCMGGFVVTLLYGFSRPTADLDVLTIAPRESQSVIFELARRGGPLHHKYHLYIDIVGVAAVPENYEERLTEMFPGKLNNLHLLALDPYDLALSKLERNSQKDREDFFFLFRTIPLKIEVLTERYNSELRWQLGNPDREDRTFRLWLEALSSQE